MPFTDPAVSSVSASGRNSRASNVSGISASIRSQPMPAHVPKDTLASAGVMSMLKTSTDTGDIGALSFNHARLPAMPRATHQMRGHHPRLSGSSHPAGMPSHHRYAPSQTSKVSSSREWDSASTQQRRGSLTSMQSMPPSLPPVHLAKGPLQMPPQPSDLARDSRSFSMTSAPAAQPLPRHRSANSLKSQGHEPRHPPHHLRAGHHGQPMHDNRPPYVYPTRLKRPGYRSPSPALSDTYSQGPPPPVPPMPRRGPMPSRPQPQHYNSDYGTDYNNDPRHLNVRPPPRGMSNSPVMGYGELPAQYPYRNPAAMRSAPGLSMHPQPPGAYYHPQVPPHAQHSGRPVHHQQPAMHRQQHANPRYATGPGYAPYPTAQYPHHRGPPPSAHPSMAPMAHHMFHNAARMARQLPQRTDTPLTDTGLPSSDPPSSGTAPTSSDPPTPRDPASIQVAVDPAFIDPAMADLPDSSSEPVFAHQYLRYTEALEKDIEESEIEAAHPSVPPSGFVQRVKAMLESKAAVEAAAKRDAEHDKLEQYHRVVQDIIILETEDEGESHEMAANETPRFTFIEEFEAPVELPASPVKLPELGGSPVQLKRRITRELVKAGLGPSDSVDNTMITMEAEEVTTIDEIVKPKATSNSRNSISESKAPEEQGPATPARGEAKRQDDSKSEAASSPAGLGLSAVDYATRFDTTMTSEETKSQDPFALDADTITLQHQRSKDNVANSEPVHEAEQLETGETHSVGEEPVSPILAGQEVSRCSAVSPLHTQTLGIDETLKMASEPAQEGTASMEEHTVPGAFPNETLPDETQPPPTPKTPKTYSKSVQLRPSTLYTDTPSSNRFSLPPDLSTVADTTMNSDSNMITDVAVRFSLPQTTITISKPQIIEIPPTSSPEREPPPPLSKPAKPALHASDTKSKRGSVTFADEVAPLKINKKPEQHSTNDKTHDTRISKGKSIVRKPSPLQQPAEPTVSREITTELRFSNLNGFNSRFGSTHLPGLKEESVDEMSISDKHKTDTTNGSQFPLPARIAAVKAMQERRLQESADKAKARRTRRHPNRTLAETRDLPSLNFSRMDLIDKLNEALEVRESKSMEVIRRREFSGIYCPSPQRPQSTEPLRERYMSFFSKPEDFSHFLDDSELEDEDETDPELGPAQVPTVEVQPNTEIDLSEDVPRSLSPEVFLDVATQVNRLSIPSVNNLSARLSDLLPNLKELNLDSVLANFGEISEDIRRLGECVRPDTVLSNRTSAGFRTLAERAEEIVKNGTHDSTVQARLLKELPPPPESMSADKVSAINSVEGKQSYLSGSVSAPTALGEDVTRPQSALTRSKSPLTEEEVQALLPPEMNPIARAQKRAMIISSGSSRPWNQDENYPWAGTKVDVDLSVPSEAHTHDSIASEALRKRKTKSLDMTSSGEVTDTTKGIDIGSILEPDPTTTLTDEQLTGISPRHQQQTKHTKRSVIGSITRRIQGLGGRCDGNTAGSIPSPVVQPGIDRSASSVAHRPGERYPTSGLTPPANFNLDEVRSFFSDNSSEKERNASFRKRLTNLKSKGKSVRHDHIQNQTQQSRTHGSLDGNADTAYDAGELGAIHAVERVGASSSAQTYDGVGMGKTEFRIKRFGEKLRHLLAKGGELVRSLSQRSKAPRTTSRNERVRDDWLSDSLYSGV